MRSLKRPRIEEPSPEIGDGGVPTSELHRGLEEFLEHATEMLVSVGRDVLPIRSNCDEMKKITHFMTRALYYSSSPVIDRLCSVDECRVLLFEYLPEYLADLLTPEEPAFLFQERHKFNFFRQEYNAFLLTLMSNLMYLVSYMDTYNSKERGFPTNLQNYDELW